MFYNPAKKKFPMKLREGTSKLFMEAMSYY